MTTLWGLGFASALFTAIFSIPQECLMHNRCSLAMAKWSNEVVAPQCYLLSTLHPPPRNDLHSHNAPSILLLLHPMIVSHSIHLSPSQTLSDPWVTFPRGKTRLAQLSVCVPRYSTLTSLCISFPGTLWSPQVMWYRSGHPRGHFP